MILGLLSAAILCGDQFGRIVGLGALAHWLVTVMILVRRNSALTRTDLDILHYGCILFMVLVVAIDFVAAVASSDL
jgi:hypothetical protein